MRLGGRTVRDLALAFSLISSRRGDLPRLRLRPLLGTLLAWAVAPRRLPPTWATVPRRPTSAGCWPRSAPWRLASVHPQAYGKLLAEDCVPDAPRSAPASRRPSTSTTPRRRPACSVTGACRSPAAPSSAFGGTETQDAAATGLARVLVAAEQPAEGMSAPRGRGQAAWSETLATLDASPRPSARTATSSPPCSTAAHALGGLGPPARHPDRRPARAARCVRGATAPSRRVSSEEASPAVTAVPSEATAVTPSGGQRALPGARGRRRSGLLRLASHLLSADGYEVLEAQGAAEGVRMALEHVPDIVLSDLAMPEMDGFEPLPRPAPDRGRIAHVHRARHGARGGRDDRQGVRRRGGRLHQKPYLPRVLCARIRGGVRATRLQRKVALDRQKLETQKAELGRLNRKLQIASLTDPLTAAQPAPRDEPYPAVLGGVPRAAARPEPRDPRRGPLQARQRRARLRRGGPVLIEVARTLASVQQGRCEVCRQGVGVHRRAARGRRGEAAELAEGQAAGARVARATGRRAR